MEHGRVEFTSSHLLVLAELRQRAPSARIGLFVADRPEWMPLELHWRLTLADAIALGAAAVHTPAPRFDTTWVKSCHDAGLISHAADADTPDMIRQVLDMGAKRISTREPRLASAIIDGSGQPLGRTASQSK
jgi:glycerophosphoryl diester phosphodiesterase